MYIGSGTQTFPGSASFEIPEGDAGTAQTIDAIRELVFQGVRDVAVNRTAVSIVHDVPAHRPALEARAIYDWVRSNIRFTPDIATAETLRTAAEILTIRAGDCDCINGVLLPALFTSVGLETRLVTVAADASRPEIFSHIYPEVQVNGQWTPADGAAEHASWGKEPGHVYRKRVWSLEDNSFTDLKGCDEYTLMDFVYQGTGAPRLSGLGQDDSGDDSGFDWGALTQAIQVGSVGIAQVVQAAKQPLKPVIALPNSAVSTVYGTGASGVGSAGAAATATATVSTSASLFVGVGLLALVGLLVAVR